MQPQDLAALGKALAAPRGVVASAQRAAKTNVVASAARQAVTNVVDTAHSGLPDEPFKAIGIGGGPLLDRQRDQMRQMAQDLLSQHREYEDEFGQRIWVTGPLELPFDQRPDRPWRVDPNRQGVPRRPSHPQRPPLPADQQPWAQPWVSPTTPTPSPKPYAPAAQPVAPLPPAEVAEIPSVKGFLPPKVEADYVIGSHRVVASAIGKDGDSSFVRGTINAFRGEARVPDVRDLAASMMRGEVAGARFRELRVTAATGGVVYELRYEGAAPLLASTVRPIDAALNGLHLRARLPDGRSVGAYGLELRLAAREGFAADPEGNLVVTHVGTSKSDENVDAVRASLHACELVLDGGSRDASVPAHLVGCLPLSLLDPARVRTTLYVQSSKTHQLNGGVMFYTRIRFDATWEPA